MFELTSNYCAADLPRPTEITVAGTYGLPKRRDVKNEGLRGVPAHTERGFTHKPAHTCYEDTFPWCSKTRKHLIQQAFLFHSAIITPLMEEEALKDTIRFI